MSTMYEDVDMEKDVYKRQDIPFSVLQKSTERRPINHA